MEQILIIDDDRELCELVAELLGEEGFRVEVSNEGARGLERALSGEHALVVLDVMMPGMNGFEVLRRLRAEGSDVHVMMLTARGDDIDRIVGLEIGADDYLPKPFNPRELLARINAVLRRTRSGEDDERQAPAILTVGDIAMDRRTRIVTREGRAVELTVVEFDLLEKLLRAPGQIIPREELVRDVLHRSLSPFDRSIDMHVSNLRKKLGHQVRGVERIKTVRGVGYIYAQQVEAKEDGS